MNLLHLFVLLLFEDALDDVEVLQLLLVIAIDGFVWALFFVRVLLMIMAMHSLLVMFLRSSLLTEEVTLFLGLAIGDDQLLPITRQRQEGVEAILLLNRLIQRKIVLKTLNLRCHHVILGLEEVFEFVYFLILIFESHYLHLLFVEGCWNNFHFANSILDVPT